jgi:hypothetical protein
MNYLNYIKSRNNFAVMQMLYNIGKGFCEVNCCMNSAFK